MGTKAYWLYRLRGQKVARVWRFVPLVIEESAFLAKHAAAIALQSSSREAFERPKLDPKSLRILNLVKVTDPIHPEWVEVARIEQGAVWCVEHDEGWCAIKRGRGTATREHAYSVLGASARTLCKWWVNDVECVAKRLPTCDRCALELTRGTLISSKFLVKI